MELARKPTRMRKYVAITPWHSLAGSLCGVLLCSLTAVGQNAHTPIARQDTVQSAPAMQTLPPVGVANVPAAVSNQYAQVQPQAGQGTLAAARQAENRGMNAEAKRLYEIALQHAPDDRLALLSYARMLHRLGEFEASIGLYNRLLSVHRNDPVAMNDLSLCYARQGNMQQALALLAGAVSLQPESKRYRNNIAKLLIEVNRKEEAFSHLEHAHGGAIAHFNMGSMLHQRGRDREALDYLRAAVEMDPSLTPAIDLLAELDKPIVVDQVARLPVSTNPGKAENADDVGTPVQLAKPAAKQAWEPGSVRLQSMETAGEPNAEAIKWAVAGEAVEDGEAAQDGETVDGDPVHEQNTWAAPVPFETPIRRYTRPQRDPTQSYLDRQANQD